MKDLFKKMVLINAFRSASSSKVFGVSLVLLSTSAYAYSGVSSNSIVNKCLDLEVAASSTKVIEVSDFVDIVDESISFSSYGQIFGAGNQKIEEEKNIHDGAKNYNYYFDDQKGSMAVFTLGPLKEKGKKVLSCAWIESSKFDTKVLRIGLPLDYFKNKFGFKENVEKLVFELGDNAVELYFSKGLLFRYRYRNMSYNG